MSRITHFFLVGALVLYAASARGESVAWIRQLGTANNDQSFGVSANGMGNVYITGLTLRADLGGPSAGASDAFVSKFDSAGVLLWTRQLGTTTYDESFGVSADDLGNVYITGYTEGSLAAPHQGGYDAFVSKYDGAGSIQWTRQIGTAGNETGAGISADGWGNVYVSGYTTGTLGDQNSGFGDAYVSKYDAGGALRWTRQLGTGVYDSSSGLSTDTLGNIYITGETLGSLGGPNAGMLDAYIAKYDAAGSLLWTRQLGTTSDDQSFGVSTDGLGNAYISGRTFGSLDGLNSGDSDAFLSKYDAVGNLLWTRQFGTPNTDQSAGVTTDGLGNVYISGTSGGLGIHNDGNADVFAIKYDSAGSLIWTRSLGTISNDNSYGVSADGSGSVYLTGLTGGSLGGPNAGLDDAFVTKIDDRTVPEPSAVALAAIGMIGLAAARGFRNSYAPVSEIGIQ